MRKRWWIALSAAFAAIAGLLVRRARRHKQEGPDFADEHRFAA